ncbi:MAG: 30S ribosomal protein S12 methylthiotransferase RimO [Coriobacteriaceae bacterium]|nr:30S ribosomal protein S12 methylthiotransferase RimO [Coriobacteriaceae bacterium]
MTVRVSIVTLGCPKNEVDSGRMAALVASSGYELTDDLEEADVAVLNTCAFIREAVEESVAAALDLGLRWKVEREGRRIVLAGCMPSRYAGDLETELPEVDAFLPVAEESALLATLERLTGERTAERGDALRSATGSSAYLMVSDGCFRSCAYCTIPAIRGDFRSTPADALEDEARALIATGAREIVLVGQDISSWGRDMDGGRLADVVGRLAALEGLAWLRLMYVQPDGVTDELLEAMASAPAVCRYLDLPLQHASRDVLRRMGRAGDAESHLALLARIRAAMPDIVLRTSLIAGFPGETEGHLTELEAFLEAARFDYAGVFAYSPEEGTPAASMRPRVPARERMARANRVREVADRIGFERAADRIGSSLAVLIEGVDEDGATIGRWRGQAPEIDGVVSLDRPGRPGGIVRARIVDALGYDLLGEVEQS